MNIPSGTPLFPLKNGEPAVAVAFREAGRLQIMGPYSGWKQSFERLAATVEAAGGEVDWSCYRNERPATLNALVPASRFAQLTADYRPTYWYDIDILQSFEREVPATRVKVDPIGLG